MSKDTTRQILNALSVAIALTVNILASALPLNGQNTGEISDRFPVYFVPAGYVFAIWSVIFIGWIAFAVYQFLPAQKESPRFRNLGYLFAISGLLLYHQIIALLPPSGVRLNEFQIDNDKSTVRGEASDTQKGLDFREQLTNSPALSRFDWNIPVPKSLDGTRVQFDAVGTYKPTEEVTSEGQ